MPPILGISMQQPENQKAWASASASTLNKSKELTSNLRKMLQQCQMKNAAEVVKIDQQSKHQQSALTLASFEARIVEVKEAIRRVGDALVSLSHACKAKWG